MARELPIAPVDRIIRKEKRNETHTFRFIGRLA